VADKNQKILNEIKNILETHIASLKIGGKPA
jgi:hypothetical protein